MTGLCSHRVAAKDFPKQTGWKVPRKVTETGQGLSPSVGLSHRGRSPGQQSETARKGSQAARSQGGCGLKVLSL